MPSSLFAQQGDDENDDNDGRPSLGGTASLGGGGGGGGLVGVHHGHHHDHEQSPLEALIERSSEQARSGLVPVGGSSGEVEGGGFFTETNHRHHNIAGLDVDLDQDYNGIDHGGGINGNGRDDDYFYLPASTTPHCYYYYYSPYMTLLAGIFCILQIGMVFGSYLAVSWFDTHLLVTVELPPVVKTDTDTVIHSTTLASLIQNLLSSEPPQHWAATALIIASLVWPCLACVCTTMWTYFDRKEAALIEEEELTAAVEAEAETEAAAIGMIDDSSGARRRRGRRHLQYRSHPTLHNTNGWWEIMSGRNFMEYTIRLSFLVFFLLIVINVGTSSMEINSHSTRFVVNNRIRGGLASYSLGIFCSLGVFLILRIAKKPTTSDVVASQQQQQQQQQFTGNSVGFLSAAPPDQAFQQLPWNISNNNNNSSSSRNSLNDLLFGTNTAATTLTLADEEGLQTPLITTTSQDVRGGGRINGGQDPLTNDEQRQHHGLQSAEMVRRTSSPSHSPLSRLPFWKRAVVYEVGAVSLLLWFPALFLPLFHLSYDGIISDFMTQDSLTVKFWEFPAVLWQRCDAAGTELWIMATLGSVLIGSVYVSPVLATILCIATWTIEDRDANAFCHRVLGIVQPTLCGVVFVLSVYLAVPAFESISEIAIDQGSNGICEKFSIITSDTCLRIYGHRGLGFPFLLAQSLCLEVFVVLTLVWKRPYYLSLGGGEVSDVVRDDGNGTRSRSTNTMSEI